MPSNTELAYGGIGSLISGLLGQNQLDWQKNALVNILNNLNEANSFGRNYGLSQFDPASAAAQQLLQVAPQLLFGANGSPGDINVLRDSLQGNLSGLNPGAFTSNSGLTPQMQSALDLLSGTGNGINPTAGLLQNVVANGGGSDASKAIWDRLLSLTDKQNPFTSGVQNTAADVVNGRGMTPQLSQALNALQYIVNQGGSNQNINQGVSKALSLLSGTSPIIDQLTGAASGGLQNNLGVTGLTPTGAIGEKSALQGIQNGGMNPITQFFSQRGMQLAGKDAVLPTLLAMNMARDEGTKQMTDAAKAARAQALAHGGGPGAVVANGTTNDALADFSDKAGENIAALVEQALQQQQALNLQQQGQGAQMGLSAGSLANANLNSSSSLLNGLENVATNRFGVGGGLLGNAGSLSNQQTGLGLSGLESLSGLQSQNVLSALGMIPGVNNAATNNAGVFGNLGLNAGQLDLSRLSTGLSGLQGNLNQANNYTLGASGALNGLVGTQGNIFNSLLNGNLGAGQLGLGQTNSFYDTLGKLLSNQGNLVGTELGMSNNGLNGLLNIGSAGFGLSNTALNGMPHIFSGYQAQNPMGNGIGGFAGAIGSLLGGI